MIQTSKRFSSIADPTVMETLKLTQKKGVISFAGGTPSPHTFATTLLKQALVSCKIDLQYSPAQGLLKLRQTIANKFSAKWSMPITPDQVLIASGSQQALDLVARTYLDMDDTVLIQNPTYFVALYAFNAYMPKYAIVNIDKPNAWPGAKLLYLIPTFQNPTGETISEKARAQIAKRIILDNTILVEDDPYSQLYFNKKPPKAIATMAPKNTIYITSVSKTLGPAMRLGIIIAKPEIITHLARVRTGMDLCTSGWIQAKVCGDGVPPAKEITPFFWVNLRVSMTVGSAIDEKRLDVCIISQ